MSFFLIKQNSQARMRLVAGIGLLWLAGVAAGFALLQQEEFTPAPSPQPAAHFPPGSTLTLAPNKPTLLVFLHPYCPCSRATLHQLDQILAQAPDNLAVTLIFTIPDGLPPGWEKEGLWQTALAMPGVRVVRDDGGAESLRFHVAGSGHALLFDPTGRLLFSGGITGSRGHEGDNPGQDAIVAFVRHGQSEVTRVPVFGCSLL